MSDEHPVEPVAPAVRPTFGGWMGSMWLYTSLRFGLFGALWGILYLIGLPGFASAFVGLLLSVPLSLVLLAKPRSRFTAQLEARVDSRRVQREDLDTQLDPDAFDREAELRDAAAEEARRVELRKKSRRSAATD